jgi:hypothetical protein
MTDEKIIDAEFDKDDCGPFDSPISAYKAGFRTAERLAKIEVLEEVFEMVKSWSFYTGLSHENACASIENMIGNLKAGQDAKN